MARHWRTGVDPDRLAKYERFAEYERFAVEHSLPIFRRQRGFLGVLVLHEAADRAAAHRQGNVDSGITVQF